MKVLFVYSGNKPGGIGILVKNQLDSLKRLGTEIYTFPITGKGLTGYLTNALVLKKKLSKEKFDIVHAHYSFSAYVASVSGAKPLVVSLMGSDINSHWSNKSITRLFAQLFKWNKIIVKSAKLGLQSGLNEVKVIPNGVDIGHFKPIDGSICKNSLGWDQSMNTILFAANPCRPEKNFKLAEKAVQYFDESSICLRILENVSYEDMPIYMNAADLILLTSRWEGSPNVIKEAMACNRPIVSTDVGDVNSLMEGIPGCFIADSNPEDVADKIRQALQFKQSVGTRQRIIDRGLEVNETARKLISIYEEVIKEKGKRGKS